MNSTFEFVNETKSMTIQMKASCYREKEEFKKEKHLIKIVNFFYIIS